MKYILKLILPPFIFLFLKNLKMIIKKVSYNNKVTYDDDFIAKVVITKNIIYRDKLEIKNELDLFSLRSLLAVSIARMDLKSKTFNVLDFGGGGGYHYFISKLILNEEIQINWHVVETPSIVKNSNIISNQNLQFFKTIEEATKGIEKFDLVLASSSLQYCEDQFLILQQIKKLRAKNIFITRTPFTKGLPVLNKIQFSKLSSNGPGKLPVGFKDCTISYPIYIQNIDQFEKEFINDYKLKFKVLEEHNAFIIENYSFDNYGYFYVLNND